MTDEELCGRLRSMLPASGFAPTENWAPWLGADRIEQLEREKAIVSDLWEQQKEIALGYLADCNALGAENERLREVLGFAMRTLEAEGFREDGPTMTRIRAALGEKQ